MSDEENRLRARLREVESELASKTAELQVYKAQLSLANKQLEKVISQMGQELKMASQLQKHLSPTEISPISGFEFSTKFTSGLKSGGDYFDIFELPDRMKFGILVSSASGYSLSALFLSVLIKISTAKGQNRDQEPHRTIATLLQELQPQMGSDDRLSLFYGVVDKRSYDFSFCHVGQQQVYLQVAGKEALENLDACHGTISKTTQPTLRTMSVPLSSKDRLIICTEGVIRATDENGQMWGAENLREAIRQSPKVGVHELRNEILYRLEQFTHGREPERDQTVVVTEVKDRVIKLAKG